MSAQLHKGEETYFFNRIYIMLTDTIVSLNKEAFTLFI